MYIPMSRCYAVTAGTRMQAINLGREWVAHTEDHTLPRNNPHHHVSDVSRLSSSHTIRLRA
jgi:hypothetical protein